MTDMRRIDAIRVIAERAKQTGAFLICNIGIPCKELYSMYDAPGNFYMLGSMGLASSIGFGLALSKPDRDVMVIEGDGSMLMNLGSLASIATRSPDNLLLVVIDNGSYGSTGDQSTATANCSDLAQIAKGAGNRAVYEANDLEQFILLIESVHYGVIVVKVAPGNVDLPNVGICPVDILKRFMDAVLRSDNGSL